ncbi:hypothetical protein DFH06DRAFT_1334741 [Mycena polygramma]|nr:hypothetical protein DFH06DRAFT_1334741 [Mycena polygramma]
MNEEEQSNSTTISEISGKKKADDSPWSHLPRYASTGNVHYLTTESDVDDALAPIKDGVVSFDTEFTKRTPTKEEQILDRLYKASGGNKKSMMLAWQVIERDSNAVFPIAWDNIALCIIQIARAEDVWVINLNKIRALPAELERIICSEDIIKVCVGLSNDVIHLWCDFRIEIKNMVDAGLMAKLLFAHKYPDQPYGNLSLQSSVAEMFGKYVGKEDRESDWKCTHNKGELDDDQLRCKKRSDRSTKPTNGSMKKFSAFPNEVLALMLLHTFGRFSFNPRSYDDIRSTMRLVCSQWYHIIEHSSEFWTSVFISLCTTVEDMHHRFDKASDGPLEVCLDFVDNSFLNERGWSSSDPAMLINGCFARLHAGSNCVLLVVNSFTQNNSARIAAHVARLQLPRLKYLKAAINPYTPDSGMALVPGIGPNPVTPTGLPGLIKLHVQGAFPSWQHGRPYSNLTKLTLHLLCGRTALTWHVTRELFEATPLLTELRIEKVEFRGFPFVKENLPIMNNLRVLTLNVTSPSIPRLVGSLVAPSLRKLNLTATTDANIYQILISNFAALSQITHLNLVSDCQRSETLVSMMAKMPQLAFMDVRGNTAKLSGLLADATCTVLPPSLSTAGVCPNLNRMYVSSNMRTMDLTALVVLRQGAFFDDGLVVSVAANAQAGTGRIDWVNTGGQLTQR